MKISVEGRVGKKLFSVECESTDTIAHLKAKLHESGIPFGDQSLVFDGKLLGDNFSENMTLADIGVQDGSFIPKQWFVPPGSLLNSGQYMYLRSTMNISVAGVDGNVYSFKCEPADTIANLKAELHHNGRIPFVDQSLVFEGKLLGDNFSEDMRLADVGVQDGSIILHQGVVPPPPPPVSSDQLVCLYGHFERPRPIYYDYASAFKFGWKKEYAEALLHLVLELCQDGTISEGNMTDEAWLRIQNGLKNSTNCIIHIDFLKKRLRDYRQLYSVLTNPISSSTFNWDRERKTITTIEDNWREKYPELILLCGQYIPYFDTLEKVCLLLNINNPREASPPREDRCVIQ